MFRGSIPALVTPFRGGKVDEAAFERLVNRQIDAGSHALVSVRDAYTLVFILK